MAIISSKDWIYLIEAKRPPKFYFLPSVFVFLDNQLEYSLENEPLIFVQKNDNYDLELPDFNPALKDYFEEKIKPYYKVEAERSSLVALKSLP